MSNLTVRDIMNVDFAKISENTPVVEASMELIKKEALGGPVIDENKKLLGWVSEQECLQVVTQFTYHNERISTVKDIMRDDVLTIDADQAVFALAEKMNTNLPKNYPVVDENNKVIGVINRRRVLKALLASIS